jgi:hypothetical protein
MRKSGSYAPSQLDNLADNSICSQAIRQTTIEAPGREAYNYVKFFEDSKLVFTMINIHSVTLSFV